MWQQPGRHDHGDGQRGARSRGTRSRVLPNGQRAAVQRTSVQRTAIQRSSVQRTTMQPASSVGRRAPRRDTEDIASASEEEVYGPGALHRDREVHAPITDLDLHARLLYERLEDISMERQVEQMTAIAATLSARNQELSAVIESVKQDNAILVNALQQAGVSPVHYKSANTSVSGMSGIVATSNLSAPSVSSAAIAPSVTVHLQTPPPQPSSSASSSVPMWPF